MSIIDIEALRLQVRVSLEKIRELHNQGNAGKKRLDELKKQEDQMLSQMGWREKSLNGLFGGDKSKVKDLDVVKTNLLDIRNSLVQIDKDIETENQNLNETIKRFLSANSTSFQKLITENSYHQSLLNSSKAFQTLLLKAKKGISDALLFMSWDSLLNHPKAQGELNNFFGKVRDYQNEVDSYHKSTGSTLQITKLESLIKFSSEKEGKESFKNVLSAIDNNISLTQSKSKENEALIQSNIDEIKKQLFKSN